MNVVVIDRWRYLVILVVVIFDGCYLGVFI